MGENCFEIEATQYGWEIFGPEYDGNTSYGVYPNFNEAHNVMMMLYKAHTAAMSYAISVVGEKK